MIRLLGILLLLWPVTLLATPIADQSFKSPAFNGVGYSSHVLTIENQEYSRHQQLMKDIQATLDKAASDAKNTNLHKYMSE